MKVQQPRWFPPILGFNISFEFSNTAPPPSEPAPIIPFDLVPFNFFENLHKSGSRRMPGQRWDDRICCNYWAHTDNGKGEFLVVKVSVVVNGTITVWRLGFISLLLRSQIPANPRFCIILLVLCSFKKLQQSTQVIPRIILPIRNHGSCMIHNNYPIFISLL
jgi:hypothetical protein